MIPFEQQIWVAVYAGEVVKQRSAIDGGSMVDDAARAADFAVADLARYRKAQEEALEVATRPAEKAADPVPFEKGKGRR